MGTSSFFEWGNNVSDIRDINLVSLLEETTSGHQIVGENKKEPRSLAASKHGALAPL